MIGQWLVLPSMVQGVRHWLTTFEILGHQQPLYGMALGNDRLYFRNGCLYVPLHSVPLAAGVFLPISADSIDQHLELPPEHEFRHGVRDRYVDGKRTHRQDLFAARIRGNSMIERDVLLVQDLAQGHLHELQVRLQSLGRVARQTREQAIFGIHQ